MFNAGWVGQRRPHQAIPGITRAPAIPCPAPGLRRTSSRRRRRRGEGGNTRRRNRRRGRCRGGRGEAGGEVRGEVECGLLDGDGSRPWATRGGRGRVYEAKQWALPSGALAGLRGDDAWAFALAGRGRALGSAWSRRDLLGQTRLHASVSASRRAVAGPRWQGLSVAQTRDIPCTPLLFARSLVPSGMAAPSPADPRGLIALVYSGRLSSAVSGGIRLPSRWARSACWLSRRQQRLQQR